MFNSGIRNRRAKDNEGIINPQNKFIQSVSPLPSISSYSISGFDDTALDPAGGQTIIVNGTGFATGMSAMLGGTQIGAVSIVNSSQLTFTSPTKSPGTYSLVIYSSSGTAAILAPGLTYSSFPTFTTAAGSIGSVYETNAINSSVVATSDSSVTYSLVSGSLPTGATLSSNGTITGTAPVDSGSTTYTFSIKATDAELQDVTRTFTLTVNTDVVTWSTPPNNSTVNLDGSAYSQSLVATSAAGKTVSYTANSLPTGLTLSSGTISGTPTVEGTSSTLLTATAATTNRSATNTITWVVSLTDKQFMYNSLLLSADTSLQTPTFANDASLNNAQLTVFGDARASNFDGISPGYSSIYLNGSSCYRIATASAVATGPFTMEAWIHPLALTGTIFSNNFWDCGWAAGFSVSINSNGTIYMNACNGVGNTWPTAFTTTNSVTIGSWYHIAITRDGTDTLRCFINGVQGASVSWTYAMNLIAPYGSSCYGNSLSGAGIRLGAYGQSDTVSIQGYYSGYISNFHVDNTTAYYTSGFTTPTTPVTKKPGTLYLAAHTPIDWINESGPGRIASSVAAGTPVQSNFNPFTTKYQYTSAPSYSTNFGTKTDYISTPATTALTTFTGDFTMECWIFPSDTSVTYWGIWDARQAAQTANSTVLNIVPLASAVTGQGRICYYNGGYNYGTGIVYYNKWSHIAIVRSGSTMTFYINGVAGGTATISGTQTANATTNPVYIGSKDSGLAGYGVVGSISNFRIVNGTAVYTANFTPSTTPLTAITNTVLLTLQDGTLKDNSTNAYALTLSGTVRPMSISPFTQPAYSGTLASAGCGYFDGTGDYLTVPNYSVNWSTFGSYTFEFWVYHTAVAATNQTYLSTGTTGYTNFYMYGSGAATPLAVAVGIQGTNEIKTGNNVLSANNWSHIAFTYDGTTTKIYVNGVQQASGTTGVYSNNSAALQIATGLSTQPVFGYMSNVRLVKGTVLYTTSFVPPVIPLTAISNTALLTLQNPVAHNNSTMIDSSANRNLMTRNGNSTNGTFSPYGDNWSTYIGTTAMGWQTPASSHTAITGYGYFQASMTMSIEAWIYPLSRHSGGGASLAYVVGDMTLAGGTLYWGFGPDSNGKLTLAWYTGSVVTCNSTNAIPLNTWTHIAVSINAGSIKLFINGTSETLVGTATTSNVSGNGSTGYIASGGYTYGGTTWQGFNGYISDLRITKSALYSSNFTPSTTPLISTSTTGLLACQSNSFVDRSPNNFALTLTGAPQIQKFSPYQTYLVTKKYSMYFPANGSYFTGSNSNFNVSSVSIAWTFECWIFPITTGCIFAIGSGGAYGNSIFIDWGQTTANKFNISQSNGSSAPVNFGTTNTYPGNIWYHLAITRTTAGVVTIYVNGVADGTVTYTAAGFASGTTFVINGSYDNNGLGANGSNKTISNLRFIINQALYSGTFTPSTSPLTNNAVGSTGAGAAASITGTVVLLTAQNNTAIDNSGNNITITSAGTPRIIPVSSFAPTTGSLSQPYSQSVFGGSIYFDGTGDYVSTPYSLNWGFSADFTVECWIYWASTSHTAYAGIIACAGSAAGWSGWQIIFDNTNNYFRVEANNAVLITGSGITISPYQWYHIAFVRSGSSCTLYYNGVSAGTATSSSTFDSASSSLYIGAERTPSAYFNGYISDVRITKSALYKAGFSPPPSPLTSTPTITLLLNGTNGAINDASRIGNIETVGDTKITNFGPFNGNYYSVNFNGSTDFITYTQAAALSGDFTIEFWINIPSTPSINYWIYGYRNGADTSPYVFINSSGAPVLGGDITTYLTGTALTLGVWNHVAIVRIGLGSNNMKMYINGTQAAQSSSTQSFTYTGSQTIGKALTGNAYYLNGNLSNFRIVNGSGVYSSAFTPSTTPLTAISNTVLLTCQSNKFIDNSANNVTLTSNGSVKVATQNPFQINTGVSYYFDGTGDYLTIPATSQAATLPAGAFTWETWIYPTAPTTVGTTTVLYGTWNNGTNQWAFEYSHGGLWSLNARIIWYVGNYGSNETAKYSTTQLTLNTWNHIAWVRTSGNVVSCYVNGVSQTLTTYNSGLTWSDSYSNTTAGASCGVGGTSNYTSFQGYLTDMRYTLGATRYTSNFAVPLMPLKIN